MKAEISLKGKESIKEQINNARKIKNHLTYAETVLFPKVEMFEFRVPVRVSISVGAYDVTVDFRIASETPTDSESSLAVADLVKLFGLRFERQFNQYSGTFYWTAKNHNYLTPLVEGELPFTVQLGNVSTGKCEIRKVTKEVTEVREVYEAHCD